MKVYRSHFLAVTNTFDMILFFRYERMNLCLKRDLYVGSTARTTYDSILFSPNLVHIWHSCKHFCQRWPLTLLL